MSPDAEILIAIDPERYGGFYDVILEWIERELPEHRSWFTVQPLPFHIPYGVSFSLMVPWLQDPVEYATPNTFNQAVELQDQCDKLDIPVVNRVERLCLIGKSIGASIIGSTGLRTPNARIFLGLCPIEETFQGLNFPVLIRDEFGHGGPILRQGNMDSAMSAPLADFHDPCVIELIDMPSPKDGLYRKYRYVVAGDVGLPHHLQISAHWITRGKNRVINDATQAEEMAYIESPCPHHDSFVKAAEAFGLDYLAFDYSLDASGNPVVWEANPYPDIRYAKDQRLNYRNDAVTRTHAVIVAMYFLNAGLALPDKLRDFLVKSPSVQGL